MKHCQIRRTLYCQVLCQQYVNLIYFPFLPDEFFFYFFQKALSGPEDKDSVKVQWIEKLFDARYVRIYPMSWYGDHICMRAEVFGCMTGKLAHLKFYFLNYTLFGCGFLVQQKKPPNTLSPLPLYQKNKILFHRIKKKY